MGLEELGTLSEPLLVGTDFADAVQTGPGKGHQTVLHPHRLLPYDIGAVLGQQIIDLADGAGGAVLNGQYAVIRPALPQGQEDVLPGLHMGPGDILAKKERGGLVGISPRLPLIEDPGGRQGGPAVGDGLPDLPITLVSGLIHQIALLATAEPHDGLVEGGDVGPAGRIGDCDRLPGQDLLFTGLIQDRETVFLLVGAHPCRHIHAAEKEGGELGVYLVDLGAEGVQFAHAFTSHPK